MIRWKSKPTLVTKLLIVGCLLIGLGAAGLVFGRQQVSAAACSAPSTDYGTDTMTVSVPATATYVLWTRIMAPDTTNNAINVQVDSSSCYNVGGGSSIPASTWTWVNYQNGATTTPISMSLTAGSHTVKLIGTDPGVSVDRVILASDATCVPTGTGDNCATGDSTAPAVSLTAPANNSTATGNVTLTATASDASGVASVAFLIDGTVVNTDTTSPYTYSWNSQSVANGTHTIAAQATDKAGNTATSSITVTVNNTVTCNTAPSVPTGLAVSGTTFTTASLSWTASTVGANCVMQGYKVYRNGTLVTTVTSGTTFTDTALTPATRYTYTIAAIDTVGLASAQTAAVNATTTTDSTAPSAPTGLTSTIITSNAIALAWNASTDNVAVTGYKIYRNGTQVGTSVTPAYTDTSLTPSTAYAYTVKAYDASNNLSTASSTLNASTIAGPAAILGDLNADGKVNITDLSILLSHWNATSATANQGDLNADGKVNITDLSILLSHWS